jgi:hypothetical protein
MDGGVAEIREARKGERIVRFRDGQEKKMNTVDVRWQSFRIYSEKIGD